MKYDPNVHNRKTIRLKWYDYSKKWLYFITISIKDKLCLFWIIKNNKNILFDSWKMIEKYWLELESKFNNIKLHEYIVMPNHFHWIIEIVENKTVRANLCVRPDNNVINDNDNVINDNDNVIYVNSENNAGWTHRFTPTWWKFIYDIASIPFIIQWFKTMTTNEYIKNVKLNNWFSFNKKLWQRNYYEHIIRNKKSYSEISEYINNNHLKWNEDKFYFNEI